MSRGSSLQPGERFGIWTVLDAAAGRKYVRCRCDCGTERMVLVCNLRSGASRSCGCVGRAERRSRRVLLEAGQRFGRLVVRERLVRGLYLCDCDCGAESRVRGYNLRAGRTQSCGCLRDDRVRAVRARTFEPGCAIGKLTVLEDRGSKDVRCRCACGRRVTRTRRGLRGAEKRALNPVSCGCERNEALRRAYRGGPPMCQSVQLGDRFGLLVVTGRVDSRHVLVRCDCGALERRVVVYSLLSGATRSCGCGVRAVAGSPRAGARYGEEMLTLQEWGRRSGIASGTIRARIKAGWPLDEAVWAAPKPARKER